MSHKTNEELRKMQLILRVPRLHADYVRLNGFDSYIDKFTSIVSEYESFMEEKIRQAKICENRQFVSLAKHRVQNAQPQIFSSIGSPISVDYLLRKKF